MTSDELRRAISSAGHDVTYLSTDESDWDASSLGVTDLVAVAGGDGTVHQVFTQLAGTSTLVTVVPLGTANNIARALGIDPRDPLRALDDWPTGLRSSFDVPIVETANEHTRFVERVGGGLFSDLLSAAKDRTRRTGDDITVRDAIGLLRELVDDAPAHSWTITAEDRDVSGDYIGVEAMNISLTGPNMTVAPMADCGDGLLDLVLIRSDDRAGIIDHIDHRLAGEAHGLPRLATLRVARVQLGPAPVVRLHIDDHLSDATAHKPAVIEVGSLRVNLLIPRSAR